MIFFNFLFSFICFFCYNLFCFDIFDEHFEIDTSERYVSVVLDGQLGNQLFQIAAAYAYSLDHNLPIHIPDFLRNPNYGIMYNAKKLFLNKLSSGPIFLEPKILWKEPNYHYNQIPDSSRILLRGYFSSEKYFLHRRKEILELFEMPQEMRLKLIQKYPFLVSKELVVGVQIRDYRPEIPTGEFHPTYGRDYYEKAVKYFPSNAIFLVSSNHREFARECFEGLAENVIFLNESDHIEEFFALTLCKSFIISNSSFGWWASWLSQEVEKKIVVPQPWFSQPLNNEYMIQDLLLGHYTYVSDLKPIVYK